MGLYDNQVTAVVLAAAAEKVIESDLKHGGGGGIGCDMPANTGAAVGCAHHHRRGIPADNAFDTRFQLNVAGIKRFFGRRYGIAVRGVKRCLIQRNIASQYMILQRAQDFFYAGFTITLMNIINRFEPFLAFDVPFII